MKKIILIAGAVFLLLVVGVVVYVSVFAVANVVRYETAEVKKATVTTTVSGSGNIIVKNSAKVIAPVTGTVADLSIKVGDTVTRGQLLFNIATTSQFNTTVNQAVNAPVAGTITELNIQNDSVVFGPSDASPQNPADVSGQTRYPVVIQDMGSARAAVEVNEIDIPKIASGQKATLSLDALADISAGGTIESYDSTGTVAQGVVYYTVFISFETLDPRIKTGMSTTAVITTQVKNDVLVVPNDAVKTLSDGKMSVDVLVNGAIEPKTVGIGISDDTNTEITEGLHEGETVVVQTIDPSAQENNNFNGGFFR